MLFNRFAHKNADRFASPPEADPFLHSMSDPYNHKQAFDVVRMLIEEPEMPA